MADSSGLKSIAEFESLDDDVNANGLYTLRFRDDTIFWPNLYMVDVVSCQRMVWCGVLIVL